MNNDSLNNTCNISELDERPKQKVSYDYDAYTKNLFSHAFKDIKMNNLSSDKAEKPLPKPGMNRLYDKKKGKNKNLINDLPFFQTKNNHSVLNNWISCKSLFRIDFQSNSNYSNEESMDYLGNDKFVKINSYKRYILLN